MDANKQRMMEVAMSGKLTYNIVLSSRELVVARYLLKMEFIRKVGEALTATDNDIKAEGFKTLATAGNIAKMVVVADSYNTLDEAFALAEVEFSKPGVHKAVVAIPYNYFQGVKTAIDKDFVETDYPGLTPEEAARFKEDYESVKPAVEEVRKIFNAAQSEMEDIRAEAMKIVEQFKKDALAEAEEPACPTGCEGCSNECGVIEDTSDDDEILN